jgi:hypothetical protein
MCLGTEGWNAERGVGESEVPKGTVTEPLFVTPPTLKKKDNQLIIVLKKFIRIREAQKHVDPVDPDLEHWSFLYYVSLSFNTTIA